MKGTIENPSDAPQNFGAPPEYALNAPLPSNDVKNPFANGGMISETKFNADRNSNDVMSFKNSSSNPNDMALPFGRGYGEFTQADDSRPRERFQDKVDVRSISKGNVSQGANETPNV